MVKRTIVLGIVVIVVLIIGFLFINGGEDEISSNAGNGNAGADLSSSLWMNSELKDVNTGGNFVIAELASEGKPILIESFAVWCPTCTRQQKVMKEFHDEIGDSVISVSLDTDQSENEGRVLEHTTRNGFDWRYAVSPIDVTKSLIVDFGPGIVQAPSVPMILICGNGTARKLDSGVKDIDELKEAVASCNS